MTAGDRITFSPAHEQQVRAEGILLLIADVGDDLDAVGGAIAPFERSGAVVDGHVPADCIRVALRMVGWDESAHALYRRRPTSSLKTFPVRNATLAGRSASRRIR